MFLSAEDKTAAEQLALEMRNLKEAVDFLRDISEYELRFVINWAGKLCDEHPESNLAKGRLARRQAVHTLFP